MLKFQVGKTGEFQERDNGTIFSYTETNDSHAKSLGMTHEIELFHGVRFAVINKNCANVLIAEKDDGTLVTETWFFRRHTQYHQS